MLGVGYGGEVFIDFLLRLVFKVIFVVVKVMRECHPLTLQVVLEGAHERELRDFQLWCLLNETRRLLELGDSIYAKGRRGDWCPV